MLEITMPRLSDTMEEGNIATWHKKPGDTVEVGDVLVEIETDKATMEYEAYEAGTLSKILVPEGELATIGQPIALLDDGKGDSPAPDAPDSAGRVASASERIETPDATSAASESESPDLDTAGPTAAGSDASRSDVAAEPLGTTSSLATRSAENARPAGAAEAPQEDSERQFASPLVRKLARDHDLDLSSVRGTGPGGRIIRADIEDLLAKAESGATSTAPSAPAPAAASEKTGAATPAASGADAKRASESIPLSQARRVIARRLGESARTIPHFYVTAVADAEALMSLRADLNAQLTASGRPKVSVNDLLIRASALALREHPLVNASYVSDESTTMQVHHRINVGVAVASENGLVVPVIEDADQKTVTQLGVETKKLVALANDKKLSIDQMSGGTFTISNLGMFGVEQFTAIINPPEGAILAVGGTKPEPVAVDGEVVVHQVMRYTLSADHRIIDGALAAQFLQTLTRLIESPWTIIA